MWREWFLWTLLRGIVFFVLGTIWLDAEACAYAFATFSFLDVVSLRERMHRYQRVDADATSEALWRSRRQ